MLQNKFLTLLLIGLMTWGCQQKPKVDTVLLPVDVDPTVSFRILFKVGAMHDPAGKEGLAAITASMLTEGATKQHTYEQVLEALYPIAASIENQVDKEMIVIYGRTHKDNLGEYYALLKEVIMQPAFNEDDFSRIKSNTINYLEKSLRYSQDEEFGKEALSEFIFSGTPYQHPEEGYINSVKAITLDDVKNFYQQYFTRANMVIGLGGGFSQEFAKQVVADFEKMPEGQPAPTLSVMPDPINGAHVKIIEKNANATAISFGHPIGVLRGSREFYALALATSWLGEHRNSSSHLYQVIREKRGLNYGDYAYIEHFPQGYARQFPPPNVARHHQIFQIWIRPVPNYARVFAFRAALRELDKLIENGMSESDFELTRKFLKNYTLHYAPTTMLKLGYALDDHFYGIDGSHWDLYRKTLDALTLEEVNTAIKKHFDAKNYKAVFITSDAAALKDALVNNTPSPITYSSPKPAEILAEDKEISTYPLSVKPENVVIMPADSMFLGK
jgi:zinc protease